MNINRKKSYLQSYQQAVTGYGHVINILFACAKKENKVICTDNNMWITGGRVLSVTHTHTYENAYFIRDFRRFAV